MRLSELIALVRCAVCVCADEVRSVDSREKFVEVTERYEKISF